MVIYGRINIPPDSKVHVGKEISLHNKSGEKIGYIKSLSYFKGDDYFKFEVEIEDKEIAKEILAPRQLSFSFSAPNEHSHKKGGKTS
jgi:hypothetical protein